MTAPGIPTAGLPVKGRHVLSRTGVRARRVFSQPVPTSASSSIAWDTIDEDTHGFLDPADPTTVAVPTLDDASLVAPRGVYVVTVVLVGAVSTRGLIDIVPQASSALISQLRQRIDPVEDRAVLTASLLLFAGEGFSVQAFHTTGSPVNFTGWMACYRLGVWRWDT